MRVQTLFQQHLDTSKDGLVDDEELRVGLIKAGLELSREEALGLGAFLETDDGGNVNMASESVARAVRDARSGEPESAL